MRLELDLQLRYLIDVQGADFIFLIEAAKTARQRVSGEQLLISQSVPVSAVTDPVTGNRSLRLRACCGELLVSYRATIDIVHHRIEPWMVEEVRVCDLPAAVLVYLYPSRYCQSDRFGALAMRQFAHLVQGHTRVQAISNWVENWVTFRSNSSDGHTSALDTVVDRVGVCRDFAHLMIALCRALSIPARFVTGTDYGSDPALGPPDFQAYVEVYLGHRWYLFDPTGTAVPMGFVRLATGRDAADVSFATVFGNVQTEAPRIHETAVADAAANLELPWRSSLALSSDDGP